MVRGKPRFFRASLLLFGATVLLSSWTKTAYSEPLKLSPAATPEIAALDVEIPALPSLGDADRYLSVEEEVRLLLKLNERRVYVYQGDRAIGSYPVAVGKKGWETPKGNYQVIQMIRDPSWKSPWTGKVVPAGPNNPIGIRWIGFWTDGKNTIGFHGTPNEGSVGQAVSHGCVRMFNRDIQQLFEQVAVGTPVIVEP